MGAKLEVWPRVEKTEIKQVEKKPFSQEKIYEKLKKDPVKDIISKDLKKSPGVEKYAKEKDKELINLLEWKENKEKWEKIKNTILKSWKNYLRIKWSH